MERWIALKDYAPHKIVIRGGVSEGWPQGGYTICEFREQRSGAKRGQAVRWLGFAPEDEQRAALIAAAPALLEAAIKAREGLRDAIAGDRWGNLDHVLLRDAIHDLNAAIALAESKSDGEGA